MRFKYICLAASSIGTYDTVSACAGAESGVMRAAAKAAAIWSVFFMILMRAI